MINCKNCFSEDILKVYSPIGSLKGGSVFYCNNCDLIFSLFATPEKKHKYMSISCDSDWGNVRHGKKNRLNPNLNFIKKYYDFSNAEFVLDIGSNRSDFLNYINLNYPKINLTGVEPDNNIIKKKRTINIINDRFEKIDINQIFDFVYCSQTLEHIDELNLFFKKLYKVTNSKSHVYFEVPNTEIIINDTNYAEYFIDKHSIHFTPKTLMLCLINNGFLPIALDYDNYNIQTIAKKAGKNIDTNKIDYYKNSILNTRKNLDLKCKIINEISKDKTVAILGISKVFDSLVKYGGLKVEKISYLIDNYLFDILKTYRKKEIFSDSILFSKKIDILILLTGSSTKAMKKKYSKNVKKILHIDEI